MLVFKAAPALLAGAASKASNFCHCCLVAVWSLISTITIVIAWQPLAVMLTLPTMAIPVVEFSREGYKIRKVFG